MKKFLAILMSLCIISTVGCTNQRIDNDMQENETMTEAETTNTMSGNLPFGEEIAEGKVNALNAFREKYSENVKDTGNDFGIYGISMSVYPEDYTTCESWVTEINGISNSRYQLCIMQNFDQEIVEAENVSSTSSKTVTAEQPSSVWAYDRYDNTVTVIEVNWSNPVWSTFLDTEENR